MTPTPHDHVPVLKKMYADLATGNAPLALAVCADALTFQISGKSPLAGKYSRADFASGLMMKQRELSGGTYALEIHDILASEQHATVLGTAKLTRGGKPAEYRTVHVWRFDGAKPLAGYEYPRDLYAYDAIWS